MKTTEPIDLNESASETDSRLVHSSDRNKTSRRVMWSNPTLPEAITGVWAPFPAIIADWFRLVADA